MGTYVQWCEYLVTVFLSQIEEGVISVDGETKEKLIAELKVLRASYYYILIDLYGNVPIVTDFKDTFAATVYS
ncbi:MAG: hypothetical protein ACLUVG_01475 [Phocaeicola vulgatus]